MFGAKKGNQGAGMLLLSQGDIDPNKPDSQYQTPLWRVSSKGHEGLIRLLLTRDDVNANKPENKGKTPL